MRNAGGLASIGMLISGACFGQETSYTSLTARAGQTIRVGYYADVTADCKMTAPKIAVVSVPKHGTLTVKSANLKTKRVQRCGEIAGPASVLFYKPHEGFSGDDAIAYGVTTASGQQRAYAVQIKVEPGVRIDRGLDKPI